MMCDFMAVCVQGNCTNVSTINDQRDFIVVKQALSVLGFDDDECLV